MDSLLSPFELFYTLSWLMWNTDTSFCGQENVLLVMAWGTFVVWCGCVAISSRAVMKEWWWVCGGELATFVVWCWCEATSARAVIKEWWWVCDGELATFIVWCGCVANCTGAIFIVGCVCVCGCHSELVNQEGDIKLQRFVFSSHFEVHCNARGLFWVGNHDYNIFLKAVTRTKGT